MDCFRYNSSNLVWSWISRGRGCPLCERLQPKRQLRLLRTHSTRWTAEEDEKLLLLKQAGKTFREIAAAIPSRTRSSLERRYYVGLRPENVSKMSPSQRWNTQDLRRLNKLRQQNVSWDTIMAAFPTRSKPALQQAFEKVNKQIKISSRTPWTGDEDATLLHARSVLSEDWRDIAARLPGRSVVATKLRFGNLDVTSPLNYTSTRNMAADEAARATKLRGKGFAWSGISAAMKRPWAVPSLYSRVRTTEKFPEGLPRRKKWTAEEDQRLMGLWIMNGCNMERMEEVTGRTIKACYARLGVLKLRKKNVGDLEARQNKIIEEERREQGEDE